MSGKSEDCRRAILKMKHGAAVEIPHSGLLPKLLKREFPCTQRGEVWDPTTEFSPASWLMWNLSLSKEVRP